MFAGFLAWALFIVFERFRAKKRPSKQAPLKPKKPEKMCYLSSTGSRRHWLDEFVSHLRAA